MNLKKKNKNDNLDNILFNKWINNNQLEENTKPIITTNNEYSRMSYKMWLGVKNYLENSSSNTNKVINKNTNIKDNIKIYTIVMFNKIFSPNKLKFIILNFNLGLITI